LLRQRFGGLNPLPDQQRLADTLGDDLLEVGDPLGLNALTVGFLPFLLQHVDHALRFLIGLLLSFDSLPHRRWRANIAQENPLEPNASRLDRRRQLRTNLLCETLPRR